MTANPEFLAGETVPASKLAALSPDPTPFTPVWANINHGTGGTNNGWFWRKGREVTYGIDLVLGTGGAVTGVIEVDYPTLAVAEMASVFVASVWAQVTVSNRHAGTAIGDANGLTRFVSNGTATGWTAGSPGVWVAGSSVRILGTYIEAA